jgi:hypothetical protein
LNPGAAAGRQPVPSRESGFKLGLHLALALGPLLLGKRGGKGVDAFAQAPIEVGGQAGRLEAAVQKGVEALRLAGEIPATSAAGKMEFDRGALAGGQLVQRQNAFFKLWANHKSRID